MSEQKKKSRVGFLVIVLFLLVLGAVVLAFYMPMPSVTSGMQLG